LLSIVGGVAGYSFSPQVAAVLAGAQRVAGPITTDTTWSGERTQVLTERGITDRKSNRLLRNIDPTSSGPRTGRAAGSWQAGSVSATIGFSPRYALVEDVFRLGLGQREKRGQTTNID